MSKNCFGRRDVQNNGIDVLDHRVHTALMYSLSHRPDPIATKRERHLPVAVTERANSLHTVTDKHPATAHFQETDSVAEHQVLQGRTGDFRGQPSCRTTKSLERIPKSRAHGMDLVKIRHRVYQSGIRIGSVSQPGPCVRPSRANDRLIVDVAVSICQSVQSV